MSRPEVKIPHPHVVEHEGTYVVESTLIPVRRLFAWFKQGTTVEVLLRRYPHLGPARILDALAFAWDNLDVMTWELLRERDEIAREIRESKKL